MQFTLEYWLLITHNKVTMLSQRVQKVKPSATLAVTQKAQELKAQGKDIIGLGTGEPDFDTPDHIKQAAIEAIQSGFTKYTPVDGTPALKQAVIDKFKRDNQLDYALDEILISTGGKQCIYNMCQALLDEGDEVIIPAPYWVSYPDMALLAGGVPKIITAPPSQRYKITAEQLDAAITPKTKLFFINSPSNPTGVAYSHAELKAIGEVLARHPQVFIATDDMYEHIQWTDEPFANILTLCPDLRDRTIVLNGVSKAYAMTGWRIGFCGGPKQLIAAMKKIQGQSTSNPCSIAQRAAEAALKGSLDCVGDMIKAFKERHDFVYKRLTEIEGFNAQASDGTFYIFPECAEVIKKLGLADDVAYSQHLIEKAGVALVPGSAFGSPGCIRISYATSMEVLDDALTRIAENS